MSLSKWHKNDKIITTILTIRIKYQRRERTMARNNNLMISEIKKIMK